MGRCVHNSETNTELSTDDHKQIHIKTSVFAKEVRSRGINF